MSVNRVCYVGIDLAVRKGRCCGIAIEFDGRCEAFCAYSWSETVSVLAKLLTQCSRCVVAIDAPLTLPSQDRAFREVDRKVIEKGFRLLPLSFRGMKLLAQRAIELRKLLENMGCVVVETHPRSALMSSGCLSVEDLTSSIGIACRREACAAYVKDVKDSIVALAVAICVDRGCAEFVEASDGCIALLKKLC